VGTLLCSVERPKPRATVAALSGQWIRVTTICARRLSFGVDGRDIGCGLILDTTVLWDRYCMIHLSVVCCGRAAFVVAEAAHENAISFLRNTSR